MLKKYQYIHELSDAELAAKLESARIELRDFIFNKAVTTPEKPSVETELRRLVARYLTEQRERELKSEFGDRSNWPKRMSRKERFALLDIQTNTNK
jgi:ribosomal protein L29